MSPLGLPQLGSAGKESAFSAGDLGSIPDLGRSTAINSSRSDGILIFRFPGLLCKTKLGICGLRGLWMPGWQR